MSGLRGCLNTCVGGGIRVDQAGQARQRNDHAYFLYLFTRFEVAVNTCSDGKGGQDYATIKGYYDGRNTIAHGDVRQAQFLVPEVAQTMNDLLLRFALN
jgi:hypothetical protein